MADVAPGVAQANALREAGFNDSEIDSWESDTRKELMSAGFNTQEIGEHFGEKFPDMALTKKVLEENIKTRTPAEGKQPKEAQSLLEAFGAGFQMSVTGLIKRGDKPDTVLAKNADMFYRIASQAGTIAGDVPAMMAGQLLGSVTLGPVAGAGGAAAGEAVAGPPGALAGAAIGEAAGAGAVAFALPTAIRATLMQHYEKGDVTSFSDFWERASAIAIETGKSAAVGFATAGVGKGVGLGMAGASGTVRGLSVAGSEVATMTLAGAAMNGEVPEPEHFLEAAILIGAFHATGKVTEPIAGKLRDIYARTGVKPSEVAQDAQTNPVIRQELLSSGKDIPEAYKQLDTSKDIPEALAKELRPPEQIAVKVPDSLNEKTNVLQSPENVELKIDPLPEKPAPKASKVERSAAENDILSKIKPSDANAKTEKLTFDEFYTKAIDDLHPLKQVTKLLAGEEILPTSKNPYELARLTRGAYGKADQFLELAPFKFDTLENTGAKPLKKILEPFKDDLEGFRSYAVSARALELQARGIEPGVKIESATEVVSKGKAKYEKAFNDLVEYQNSTLDYLRDSGILSKDAHAAMLEANKSYVPFFRLLEEGTQKGFGKGLNVKNPVKAIKGSQSEIIDPIESIIKNTYAYITLAERNRVMTSLIELTKKNPDLAETLFKKVPTEMQPIKVDAKEVAKFLESYGMEDVAAEFTIFRPKKNQLRPNEFIVYENGKRQVYEATSPLVAESIKGLDAPSANLVTKILAQPAKMLRAGSVISPDFISRNFVRDQITAFNLSKSGFTPIVDTIRGLGSLMKKDETYQQWLKSGGANSAAVRIDRDYIQEHVFKLNEETGFMDKTWNVVKSPVEALRVMSELVENATRLGEFKKAVKGEKGADAVFNAGLASREVTLDFARIGANTRAMNMITAFWNAHVQGLERNVRAFKEDPIGMTTKVVSTITIPSIALWVANHNDPRWKEIPRWQKDLFWIVMTKDHIFRIPKPAELGIIFGSLPERTMEAFFTDNPKALKDFEKTIFDSVSPGFIPTSIAPMVDHFANRSTFTGQSLVPANLEGILPEYQYTEYTSESGKMLGKMVAAVPGFKESSIASPMVIENYIRSWSGTMGQYAVRLADQALIKTGAVPDPVKPTATLADIPVIKAFAIRYPSASAQSIQDFYDRYSKAKKLTDTIQHLAKNGDLQSAQKLMDAQESVAAFLKLDGMKSAMAAQTQYIRLIYKNPEMTPDEKRQQIDAVYSQMIETTKFGNQILEKLEKDLEK